MSTDQAIAAVSLYIQRLKAYFLVRTDEALANKLGMSKQNIANWRRRGVVPSKIQLRIYNECGIFFPDAMELFSGRVQQDVTYASALHSFVRYIDEFGRDRSDEEWLRLAGRFAVLVDALRETIERHHSPVLDPIKLLAELRADQAGYGTHYAALSYEPSWRSLSGPKSKADTSDKDIK